MRFLRLLFATATLIAATSGAYAAEPKAGAEYDLLQPAVASNTGKKVEVIEFFMSSCPHCNALEPLMSAWVKKQGENIAFRRVHFSGASEAQAHAYLTLEA